MTSLLKSEATFKERAKECGLTDDEIKARSLSALAFSATTPGNPPDEPALQKLLKPSDPSSVAVRAVSSMRQLMFEAQALCVTTLKNSLEGESDKKADLAPAERQARISDQRKRLAGLDLSGPYENAFCNYAYVGTVMDQDFLNYLEPHRFLTRASEVSRDKPGKELTLDESSRILIKDRAHKDKISLQTELQLAEALMRRALACDVMQLCSFSAMDKWHRKLLGHLSENPPPHYSRISMEQLLRCDRAAFVYMAEHVPSLKRDSSGALPMDKALEELAAVPKVMYHLNPLPGPSLKGGGNKGRGRGNKGGQGQKRTADGLAKKGGKDSGKGPRMPAGLTDPNLKHNTEDGSRVCWNYNLPKGCDFGRNGACKRGSHVCMNCLGHHPLPKCPSYKTNE